MKIAFLVKQFSRHRDIVWIMMETGITYLRHVFNYETKYSLLLVTFHDKLSKSFVFARDGFWNNIQNISRNVYHRTCYYNIIKIIWETLPCLNKIYGNHWIYYRNIMLKSFLRLHTNIWTYFNIFAKLENN